MITVMGATGQVGSKIAHALLDVGVPVRALGRNARALEKIASRGADVRACELDDTVRLTDAFDGSDAVFSMVPSNPFAKDYAAEQDRFGSSILAALDGSGVSTIVALSSLGADRPDAPGVIGGLHRQELRLRTLSDADVTVLRPVSFFENFSAAVDQLTAGGHHVDSVRADRPIPMIATADIADAAVDALTSREWHGFVVRELLGQRDLSYDDATAILGLRLGLSAAQYIPLAYEDMEAALRDIGFSADYARHYVDMTRAFNSGELTDSVPRSPSNTTSTPFESYADSLVATAGAS